MIAEEDMQKRLKKVQNNKVLFMEWISRRFGAKIQGSLITFATVSLAVQF